ncbi:MAG: STAS domain-containing protein [Pseudomonadota bacterium]
MAENGQGDEARGAREGRGGSDPVILPSALDLNAAVAAHRDLASRLQADGLIEVDGSQVTRPATPGLQVLLAAARTARAKKQPFRLTDPSTELLEALADLDLSSLVPADEVRP